MDSTVPCLDLSAAQSPNHWFKLGAKPKAPASSTPNQKEPWTTAHRGKHGGKLPPRLHPPQALKPTNSILPVNTLYNGPGKRGPIKNLLGTEVSATQQKAAALNPAIKKNSTFFK